MWMAIIYFISLADYGMNLVFMVVGTYIILIVGRYEEKMLRKWPPVICQCEF
jgi:hypothetical protein